MMKSKPYSAMQKTYDDCYLVCSTAVYFEGQNNEAEALRSWRDALDQIYYHNAYRMPTNYVAKSETEKALHESLKQMERQCKERVDLLEALKKSREEAGANAASGSRSGSAWLGDGTVPPAQMVDLNKSRPALPPRATVASVRPAGWDKERSLSTSHLTSSALANTPVLPVPAKQISRSPSPDAGRKTMRTTLRTDKKGFRAPRSAGNYTRKPETMSAATLAWESQRRPVNQASARLESDPTVEARLSAAAARRSLDYGDRRDAPRKEEVVRMPDPNDFATNTPWRDVSDPHPRSWRDEQSADVNLYDPPPPPPPKSSAVDDLLGLETPPIPPAHAQGLNPLISKTRPRSPPRLAKPPDISYRREYPSSLAKVSQSEAAQILEKAYQKPPADSNTPSASAIYRKPVTKSATVASSSRENRSHPTRPRPRPHSSSGDEDLRRTRTDTTAKTRRPKPTPKDSTKAITPPSTDADSLEDDKEAGGAQSAWDQRVQHLLSNLPNGVDESTAKSILNEIIIHGDEVHWSDIAGLEPAKLALKEAVVYPFLRPDLFMGLREPARGMLLFGPPGTGKTMLARAVATESKSTFFAISASSLTSKWHGDSEKLVRALFAIAKALAPSIIFVDEIDSLLSSRSSSSEHEASRRSKTEFLIQWSDLQKAAAGRDTKHEPGDPSRVLVLAATNLPWDIDDAARRRFVRRQYIPLPEASTREVQIRTLLSHQKHDLTERQITRLVSLTDGYSGSDITSLAKDAAMGPLRDMGEALLYTPKDQIRSIRMTDFERALDNIRPSVDKDGLKRFEEWAAVFGERGG